MRVAAGLPGSIAHVGGSRLRAMNTSRPFTADSSKMAYAQAFSRSTSAHHGTRTERHASLRGLTARLHRTAKPTR
jgi:hypothetical protein